MPADFSKRRRVIYQDKLTATAASFQNLLSKAPFDPSVDPARMQGAVIDPVLIEALAEALDVYALYGITQDAYRLDGTKALLAPDPSAHPSLEDAIPPRGAKVTEVKNPATGLTRDVLVGRYFDWYINVADVGDGRSGVVAFLDRYPLLKYAMDKVTANYQANISLACQRVTADWDKISAAFFPNRGGMSALKKITTTGNDFHKGGKQVLILDFSFGLKADGRVVYKPSSVEIDCLIVGNSAKVNAARPQGYAQVASLTELMNQFNPPRQRREGFTSAALPTYTVLPYNRDSVKDAYGYIEFLHRNPVVKGPFATTSDVFKKEQDKIASLDWADVGKSDWIVGGANQEQVFYHQLGGVMAIALCLSLCDLHTQNVIVHRKKPCLIDLEEALKHPMTQVADTYLTGLLEKNYDPEGKVLKILDAGEDARGDALPIADWRSAIGKPATSRIYRWTNKGTAGTMANLNGGKGSDGEGNRNALVRGLIDGLEALADPQGNAAVQSWANRLGSTIVRFVAVATADYATSGRDFYSKCCETEIDPAKLTDFDYGEIAYMKAGKKTYFFSEQVETRRSDWLRRDAKRAAGDQLLRAWRAPPSFAPEHPKHAWRDYLNCDVPSFYHKVDSQELLNSQGDPVNVKATIDWQDGYTPTAAANTTLPAGWQANAGGAYLPQTPIAMLLAQLIALRVAFQTAGGKRKFLNEALATMPGGEKLYRDIAARMMTTDQLADLKARQGAGV